MAHKKETAPSGRTARLQDANSTGGADPEDNSPVTKKEVPSLKEFSAESLARRLGAPLGASRGRYRTWFASCPVSLHPFEKHPAYIMETANGVKVACSRQHTNKQVRQALIDQGLWPSPEGDRS